jgi:hypothetical protein
MTSACAGSGVPAFKEVLSGGGQLCDVAAAPGLDPLAPGPRPPAPGPRPPAPGPRPPAPGPRPPACTSHTWPALGLAYWHDCTAAAKPMYGWHMAGALPPPA